MSGDASEIRQLAKDFGKVSPKVIRKVKSIMPKTGMTMKKRLQADLQTSSSFKAVARSIDYDIKTLGFGGDSLIQVEVGPNTDRHPAAALAGIAYFGGAFGGGGTVPDPMVAMRLEESVFLGFMQMATEDLL